MQERQVLSTRVDLVSREEALRLISDFVRSDGKTKLVFTAYSEFFVNARSDRDFRMALEGADLVTPDGVGPLAAIYFQDHLGSSDNMLQKFAKGLSTGLAIVMGRVGQPVSGYWLFNQLVSMASEKKWRVFLLGGFGDTAEKLRLKLATTYPELTIESDPGGMVDLNGLGGDGAIEKINKFKPDLLFVAYGPVKQEKWLTRNRDNLKARVAMGVGGTFDEALGIVREAPEVFSRFGIKWLWRLREQPRRLPRIIKATVVFAWLVFVDSLRKKSR